MKNVGLALLLLLLAASASAQQTAPELQFESVPDFLKLPPGLNFGEVIGRSGRNPKQFSGGHALACPMESEIYVAETSNWRLQKVILKP